MIVLSIQLTHMNGAPKETLPLKDKWPQNWLGTKQSQGACTTLHSRPLARTKFMQLGFRETCTQDPESCPSTRYKMCRSHVFCILSTCTCQYHSYAWLAYQIGLDIVETKITQIAHHMNLLQIYDITYPSFLNPPHPPTHIFPIINGSQNRPHFLPRFNHTFSQNTPSYILPFQCTQRNQMVEFKSICSNAKFPKSCIELSYFRPTLPKYCRYSN